MQARSQELQSTVKTDNPNIVVLASGTGRKLGASEKGMVFQGSHLGDWTERRTKLWLGSSAPRQSEKKTLT